MKRPTPIRINDKFKMSNGSIWKVIRTLPGGKVDLFNEKECRFADYRHAEVREMERIGVAS